MSLRIAHVVLSLDIGGLEMLVYQLARALVRDGHHCSIFCLDSMGALSAKAKDEGIDVVLLNRKQGSVDVGILRKLRSHLHEGNFSIVHTHNIEPMFYGSMASLFLKKTRVIHTQHGIPTPFRLSNRIKARVSALFIDRFVGVSDDTSGFARSTRLVRPTKILTIFNGIDTDQFKPDTVLRQKTRHSLSIDDSVFVLVCVARLSQVKNHLRLLSIFKLAHEVNTKTCLLLVGDGPMHGAIKNNIEELKLNDSVIMIGESFDIDTFLAAADVFVLASNSEGISVSILEAMSAGLVPVVTDVGGNSEIVINDHNGFCIPCNDIDAFSKTINLLATDFGLLSRLSENARNHVTSHFSISVMIGNYVSQYSDLSNAG